MKYIGLLRHCITEMVNLSLYLVIYFNVTTAV